MAGIRRRRGVAAYLVLLAAGTAVQSRAADRVDFEKEVAPLLIEHCLSCHSSRQPSGGLDLSSRNGLVSGGDSGELVVAGKPDDSYLIERLREKSMPPEEHGRPLTDAEVSAIERWVTEEMHWPEGRVLDPFERTVSGRAGYDWPAFQPAVQAPLPAGSEPHPVDRFIRARMKEHGIAPAPPADRLDLIRRASLDLIGLPPTPDEIDAFIADDSETAYSRLIDRLLASPHYGERWARHWLDVVRYGESDGFENDKMRPHAWRYRDYVIDSFNSDKPYDRFVKEQLAGDVMEPITQEGIVASGFLVAGPWDEIQNVGAGGPERRRAHEEQLEEMIGAVTQTFLGLTVQCARCHDHKFDPIPQSDYYRIKAVFDGVDHGNRPLFTPEEMERLKRRREPIEQQLAAAKLRLAEQENKGPADATIEGNAESALVAGKFGRALDARKTHAIAPSKPDFRQTPFTVQCRAKLDDKSRFNILVANQPKESAEHWEIYTYAGSGRFSAYLPGYQPSEIISPVDITDGSWRHAAMSFDGQTVRLYVDGELVCETAVTRQREGGPAGPLWIGAYPPGGIGCNGVIDEVRIDRGVLSFDSVPEQPASPSPSTVALWTFDDEQDSVVRNEVGSDDAKEHKERIAKLKQEIETHDQTLAAMQSPLVYSGVRKQPGTIHVLDRGDAESPLEETAPGGLVAVRTLSSDWGMDSSTPEAERRLAFADWVADRRNPLTARTLVNRVWHYHFGKGLIETPSDLGFNGGQASHPELLDWLAWRFMDDGWSVKRLHRLIMSSETYRQSNRFNPSAAAIDADNRLVWRFAPRRLEAEIVRDSMLFVSGELNPAIGGPSYKPFEVTVFNTHFYNLFDKDQPQYNRRTVYRVNVNTARDPLLTALDCPAPSVTTPDRRSTTTALQALSLMNDSFVIRQARRFAQRLEKSHPELEAQVSSAYRSAYGRLPDRDEAAAAESLAREHGLASLCWGLLNSSEFLYLR